MTIHEITPTATTFLAETAERFGDHGPGPWFLIFPITFWILVIIAAIFVSRRWRGRQGENTLRDTYAKGDITEAEYRDRLAVLRQTRR